MVFEWITDNRYTCPILIYLQSIVKGQEWKYTCDGWTLMQSKNAKASCMWPRWLILKECAFWRSPIGIKLRSLIGRQQIEYRLKRDNDAS